MPWKQCCAWAVHGDKIRTTIIDPGAVESELKESTSDQESPKAVNQTYKALGHSSGIHRSCDRLRDRTACRRRRQ